MDFNVTVRPAPGGGYHATCDEAPAFSAEGSDAESCNEAVLAELMAVATAELTDALTLNWDLRIKVVYLDVPPEISGAYNWELVMPRHDHDQAGGH